MYSIQLCGNSKHVQDIYLSDAFNPILLSGIDFYIRRKFDSFPSHDIRWKASSSYLKSVIFIPAVGRLYSDRLVSKSHWPVLFVKKIKAMFIKVFQICIIKMNLLNIKNNFIKIILTFFWLVQCKDLTNFPCCAKY